MDRRKPKLRIILLFLLSYTAVLAVPIVFGYVLYDRAVRNAEVQGLEALTRTLSNHGRLLDARISEVRDTIDLVLVNAEVRSVFRDPHNVFYRYKAGQALREFVMGSRFVDDVFIFFFADDMLLTSNYSVSDPERFYGSLFRTEYANFADFSTGLSLRPYPKEFGLPFFISSAGATRRMDTWVHTVSESVSAIPAVVVVLVDHEEVQRAIGALVTPNGSAWLADQAGKVMASTEEIGPARYEWIPMADRAANVENVADGGFRVLNRNALVYTTLQNNGWSFFLTLPLTDTVFGVATLKNTFFWISLLTVLTGGILAVALANRLGRPVGETIAVLERHSRLPAPAPRRRPGGSPKSWGIGALLPSVEGVVQENERNADYIEANLSIIRDNLVQRVLKGVYRNRDELAVAQENARLHIEGNSHLVALIRLEPSRLLGSIGVYDDDNRLMALVRRYLDDYSATATSVRTPAEIPAGSSQESATGNTAAGNFAAGNFAAGSMFVHEMETNVIALLIVSRDGDASSYARGILEGLLKTLGPGREPMLGIGYGRPVADAVSSYRSLEEARHALERAGRYGSPAMVSYDEIPPSQARWRYSLLTESRLINLVKSNRREELSALLAEVAEDNQAGAVDERLRYLADAFRGTVFRILNDPEYERLVSDPGLKEELDKSGRLNTHGELFSWYEALLLRLCAAIHDAEGRKEDPMGRAMAAYLEARVFDPQFNFCQFAEHFHLAEAPMSRLFKELTGATFSQYVERLRMEQARSLLLSSQRSVAEVASEVCYSSPQAFRRAYKRYFGELPGTR